MKNNDLLKATQSILSHFSAKRIKYKHIDSVLVRLYEPILWRALKNANPYVRRNAVIQFTSAFPLVFFFLILNSNFILIMVG